MKSLKEQLYKITASAIEMGDWKRAVASCDEINQRFEEYFEGWSIASELRLRMNNPKFALLAIERALELRPEDIKAQLQRIHCWIALGRQTEAREALLTLSRLKFSQADISNRLGIMLTRLNLHAEALGQYVRAAELAPQLASSHYNVASAQRFIGDLQGAEASLNRALALNPLDYEGQTMRSSLRKVNAGDNHIDILEDLLVDKQLTEQGIVHICYALAKEFDDIDQPAQSFVYLKKGADKRRSNMLYQVETDLEIMEKISSTYTADAFARDIVGESNDEPIFVVGLPRTGTTLVERILGSHSAIFPAGELSNFSSVMMKQAQALNHGKDLSRRDLVRSTLGLDFAQLGRDYIASTRPLTGSTSHFVDKLPYNFLYLGLIHLALPNAKIINLTRHPMAACYASYKQLFRDAYPYSYNLSDLGQYYVAYQRLMDHWAHVMPGLVHTVAYEDLVVDTEVQTLELLRHCGLPWEEGCMKFHQHQQASTTASAAQVRQPIYTSSLASWRRYETHLQPLAEILQTAGIEIDT